MHDQREYGPAAYVNAEGVEIGLYPTIRADEVRVGDDVVIDRGVGRVTGALSENDGHTMFTRIASNGVVWDTKRNGDMLPLVSGEPARMI